jgi:hypothetical protein
MMKDVTLEKDGQTVTVNTPAEVVRLKALAWRVVEDENVVQQPDTKTTTVSEDEGDKKSFL